MRHERHAFILFFDVVGSGKELRVGLYKTLCHAGLAPVSGVGGDIPLPCPSGFLVKPGMTRLINFPHTSGFLVKPGMTRLRVGLYKTLCHTGLAPVSGVGCDFPLSRPSGFLVKPGMTRLFNLIVI